MQSWLVILPPLILLVTALFSHNTILSVLVGIVSAAFIGANFSLSGTITLIYTAIKGQIFNPGANFVSLYGFLLMLGAIIAMINFTGGSCAFGNIITKKLNNARKTETTSLLLSFLLCFDDYLSSMTMGCLMQPLTDKFKIPRAKLAFLIDTMASPLVVLLPLSSWIALIIRQLKLAGVTLGFSKFVQHQFNFPGGMFRIEQNVVVRADPFFTYLKSIPFIFYSLILIFCVWFIVRKKISFGPMYEQEQIAEKTGNLYGGKEPRFKILKPNKMRSKFHLSDFLVPVISLIMSAFIAIPYSGGYYLFGGTNNLLDSIRSANIFPVLFFATIVSFTLGIILALIRRKIHMYHIPLFLARGTYLMYSSVIIVFCASVFSALLNDQLHTGHYVAQLILPYINLHWLPFIVFVLTTIIALGTGSSWGTISIMIPISIPMISSLSGLVHPVPLQEVYILLPTIGAVISGSIAGAQLSPISDPITISSTSAGCYQIDHVKTQLWYILPVIVGASISFIAAGYISINGSTLNGLICMLIGLIVSVSSLYLMNKIYHKN